MFFNPSLQGSVPWSIFSELNYTYDADTLARAFLPPVSGAGSGEFFRDAARALFSVLLVRLAERGAVNTADLAKAFFEMPTEEMDALIANSIASSSVGGDSKQQRQGVISSIAIYLNGISAVTPGRWSIRDFLNGPEDSRLFIVSTDDTKAMFDPLFRLMLATAFARIASAQQIVHEDRYWFFLDEVHTLGDIRLDEQLATMRKFGVAIVTGTQSESQFITSLGRERAETVMNCLQTSLLLRASEPSMQERIAKRLGRVEVNTVNRNQALAVNEARDGAGLNNLESEKWVVMPSDIGALKKCTGYLKLDGSLPAAWVDYRSWNVGSRAKPPRRERWAPKQALPPKSPTFQLVRGAEEKGLADIRAGMAQERLEEGRSAAKAESSLAQQSGVGQAVGVVEAVGAVGTVGTSKAAGAVAAAKAVAVSGATSDGESACASSPPAQEAVVAIPDALASSAQPPVPAPMPTPSDLAGLPLRASGQDSGHESHVDYLGPL